MATCGVLYCKSSASNPNVTFYKFPKDPELALQWLKLIGHPEFEGNTTKLDDIKICSEHFENIHFLNLESRILKWNAVPTIYNKHSSSSGKTGDSAGSGSVENNKEGDSYGSCLERELVNPGKLTLKDLRVDNSEFSKLTEYTYDSREENGTQNHEFRRLLWDLRNIGCQIQLSQKNAKLIKELQSKQMSVYNFLLKCRRQYKSIEGISSICSSKKARRLDSGLSHSAALLFAEQFSSDDHEDFAHLWTMEERIRALMINKETPKLYIILEKILALPPRSELRNLLNSLDVSTGTTNNVMFKNLAERVKQWKNPKDRMCYLLFDELPLEPGLHHQQGPDKIIGFEDLGRHGKSKMPASYALMFMLRGLTKNWYQPVAYYFCHKDTPLIILRRILSEVIAQIDRIGLMILAIVCDPDAKNTSILQSYIPVQCDEPPIAVSDTRVVRVFDPPSLLRLFRDSFRKHNIQYNGKVANWSHMQILYDREKEEEYPLARKLTLDHLMPKGSMSKRMDLVEDVFSNSVASAVYIYATTDAPEKTAMPWEAMGTVKVISTIGNLYDSFTHKRKCPRESKLDCLVTESSKHAALWLNTMDFISEWRFIDPKTFKVVSPIARDGWIDNIESCLILKEVLLKKGIKRFSVLRLNLDPMRKLFMALRHNGKNSNCAKFLSDLKSYLLYESMLNSSHKIKGLSDEDCLLAGIRPDNGVDGRDHTVKQVESDYYNIPELDTLWAWEEPQLAYYEAQSVLWVSAFVARLAMRKFTCDKCYSSLVATSDSQDHFVIDKQALHLLNPSENLCNLVSRLSKFCERVLLNTVYEKGVVSKLTKVSCERLDAQWLKACESHADKITRYILNVLLRINIHQFCKKYNRRVKNQK